MKKSYYILIAVCVILLGLGLVKLYQRNTSVSSSITDQILMEDADQIKQVLAICEMDDDLDVWVQKASDILNERSKWHMQNRKIYEENPQLIQMIEEQWMDAIYQILLSLKEDSNQLKKDKKAAAIQVIVSQLMKSNQEALEGYVKNRMQQDGIAIP